MIHSILVKTKFGLMYMCINFRSSLTQKLFDANYRSFAELRAKLDKFYWIYQGNENWIASF